MTNEKGKKGNLTAQNPEQSWRVIKELVQDDEGMNIEDLDQELRAFGVDADESVRRLFELAQELSRDPNKSGQVSPHISDILNQLAPKYAQATSNAAAASEQDSSSVTRRTSSEGKRNAPSEEHPKALAKVVSFHRNLKNASPKDRAVREKNAKRLQQKAQEKRRSSK